MEVKSPKASDSSGEEAVSNDSSCSASAKDPLSEIDEKRSDALKFIEDYDLFEPFSWRTDSFDSPRFGESCYTITHAVSPKSKDNDGDPDEEWLIGGHLGSRNATLIFRSSALANPTDFSVQTKPAYQLHITYKVSQAETKLLSKLLDCHGISEVAANSSDFNLLWTGSHPKPGTLRAMAPFQRVNHFPRSYELTRKDRLYKNIERMQHFRGFKNFDFIPQTFVMPGEFRDLCSTHYRLKGPWIVKPVASSRGRGIFIVENPSQVPLEEPVVVAKYLNKPLLVQGHKCDLRLYVLVTSMDPLVVYIYEEGLVRLATVRYDASHKQLWNPCMHLCNYSINKYHSDYVKSDDPTAENVGHKWTLSALLRHLKAQGKDTALLMAHIEDVVVKAFLATSGSIVPAFQMFVPNLNNCFELYGFDILIDENLKPWLLEVNLSPSLACDSPLDVRLKSAMLADLLTLVGIPAVDPIVRPSPSTSNSSMKSNHSIKMKLSGCRRVYSADGLSSSASIKRSGGTNSRVNSSVQSSLSLEEQKILRTAKQQFNRRGGFVRIFPTVDSWAKYSHYLDGVSGVPSCGAPQSSYNLAAAHNYNQMLFTQLFPDVPLTGCPKVDKPVPTDRKNSDRKRDLSMENLGKGVPQNRQDRYERMLSQGYRAAHLLKKLPQLTKDRNSDTSQLKTQVVEMMKNGKQLTQAEARKTFSQYLTCVLHRIVESPEQEGHVEIVLKFLQKASSYLRSSFAIKVPSHKLIGKDRAAVVAKQLNDFLYLYNRETEEYANILERPSQLPTKLFIKFLEHAQECDLEEVLMLQSLQASDNAKGGSQGILKCLPHAPNNYLKPHTPPRSKNMRVSRLGLS